MTRPLFEPVERGEWEPETVYLTGDIVDDTRDYPNVDEPAGRFRSLVDQRSGLLPPRVVVRDVPGSWERIGSDLPSTEHKKL